ncbi:MAG: glycerol kinase GlpK [Polyangiales bacterium]
MSGFLLSIDQGTTGSTAMLLSPDGEVLGRANHEFPQHFPRPGWVEHDLEEIWKSVGDAVRDAIARAKVAPSDCLGIGITNQRETTVLWERSSGKAVHRAIVWQDRRTADRCQELKDAGHEELFRQRTGLVLDPYLAGTKVEWLLDHVDGARARAEKGELAFGTIDSWLVYRLSGGKVHVTDASNASRTLFYDIGKGRWDEELAAVLRVPMTLLPEVRTCSEVYAHTSGVPGLPDGIPIAGMAGDQQAALFGQTCFGVGDAKCTYGTGAFLLMNTGTELVHSRNGLLTTIAWRLGEQTVYALEGSAFIAGAAVQWLRDGLGLIGSSDEIEAKAREVDETGDVVFVPALAGLGAPHWDPHARGLIYGLTRDTTAAHLARATLEGIAFQIVDLVDAMQADAGRPIARLRVDGGAARNDLLMQFEADMLGVTIDRPENVETTALGAAYLAGMAVGVFDGFDSVLDAYRIERSFEPQVTQTERDGHLERWRDAVRRARSMMGIT